LTVALEEGLAESEAAGLLALLPSGESLDGGLAAGTSFPGEPAADSGGAEDELSADPGGSGIPSTAGSERDLASFLIRFEEALERSERELHSEGLPPERDGQPTPSPEPAPDGTPDRQESWLPPGLDEAAGRLAEVLLMAARSAEPCRSGAAVEERTAAAEIVLGEADWASCEDRISGAELVSAAFLLGGMLLAWPKHQSSGRALLPSG
jgi:hypothetical protein